MARKDEEQEVEGVEEEEEQEYDQAGTSINITEETIMIEIPRDGNEGDILGRLAKLVDGLGQ